MKSVTQISKEEFIRKFVNPIVESMKRNMSPEVADKCQVSVKVTNKSNKALDFKQILIEVDVPDNE